jgi:hypothetical protein
VVKACSGSELGTIQSNGACSRLDIRSGTLQSYARILPRAKFQGLKNKNGNRNFLATLSE